MLGIAAISIFAYWVRRFHLLVNELDIVSFLPQAAHDRSSHLKVDFSFQFGPSLFLTIIPQHRPKLVICDGGDNPIEQSLPD
jgi:hypothetical protein